MNVTLLAYRNHVVIVPDSDTTPTPEWSPSGNRKNYPSFENILFDTGKHLRASPEALELLSQMRVWPDPVGDWRWVRTNDGTCACTWFGAVYRIIDPTVEVAAKGTQVFREHVRLVPNVVGDELRAEVDEAIRLRRPYFREPLDVSDPPLPERNN